MPVRRVLAPLVLLTAALWPAATPAAAQTDPPPPGECADTMPIGDVHEGQTGVGWTVPRGTDPQPFAVEVLGVFPGGVAPGRDLILIRVSDLPGHQFIEKAGGIWGGMSGSPVYIDDKLVGAVAYGFSASPSTLGGVTPVADMRDVGDLDISKAALSDRLRARIRRASPAAVQPADFGPLGIPLVLPRKHVEGIRGGTARQRRAIRAKLDLAGRLADRGLDVIQVSASKIAAARPARTAKPSATTVVPGGNFGASLSAGSDNLVGFGTTTFVCGDRVLAFGHSFDLTGNTNLGAHDGTALDVVDDKTFGPYKIAVPGPLVGKVTQDRVSAIAARLDRTPEVFDITSSISRQSGGPTREGETEVYAKSPRFYLYAIPSDHAFYELLSYVDAFEDGSVGIDLRVSGRREDGSPFQVSFGDRWIGADRPSEFFFNSIDAGSFGVGLMLSWFIDFPDERVTLDDVDMGFDIGGAAKWEIMGVAGVRRNGGPLQTGSPICVRRGDDLTVVVDLESRPRGETNQREFAIKVPRSFGALNVRGGKGLEPFLDVTSFDGFEGLLRKLRRTPRADDAIVRIVKNGAVQRSDRTRLNRVIQGAATVKLERIGSAACS